MGTQHSRYLIIGGSAAGMAAAGSIRELDRDGPITVISEEPDMPYFRPMIPFMISGKKQADDMALVDAGPYRDIDMDIRLSTRASWFDPGQKRMMTSRGETFTFDKLLIATGSTPYIPEDIEGTDTEGVFAVRTLADSRAAAERVDHTRHAVMLGGGLLNLKVAFALLERGLAVTLVVHSPEVLSQLMDPADATRIRDALDNAGLNIQTGVSARAILSNGGGVSGVALDNGEHLACEMVCIGKGVSPNTRFIEPDALRIKQGVVVDRHTACSEPDVYAAGDVAVTFDPISGDPIVTGLWTNAVEMGRCAGYNMAGRPTEYAGTFGILNATQVADEPFVSMGIVHTEGTDCEVHAAETADGYRKVVFSADGSHLVGVLMIGDIANAGLYRLVIRERMDVSTIKHHIIGHRLHYGHLMQR